MNFAIDMLNEIIYNFLHCNTIFAGGETSECSTKAIDYCQLI